MKIKKAKIIKNEDLDKDNDFFQPSLKKFIDKNHNLLTSIGVFTALIVFSSNLNIKPLGIFLSFLFLAVAFLLWGELIRTFPKQKGLKLGLFYVLLYAIIITLIVYWIFNYRIFMPYVFELFGPSIILYIVAFVLLKTKYFHKVYEYENFNFRTGLFIFIILLTLIFIFYVFKYFIIADKILEEIYISIF